MGCFILSAKSGDAVAEMTQLRIKSQRFPSSKPVTTDQLEQNSTKSPASPNRVAPSPAQVPETKTAGVSPGRLDALS
jgi:hypothetical protein